MSKTSGCVLFLDLASAFATILRRIIFDVDSGDEAWLRKPRQTGFSREEIDYI